MVDEKIPRCCLFTILEKRVLAVWPCPFVTWLLGRNGLVNCVPWRVIQHYWLSVWWKQEKVYLLSNIFWRIFHAIFPAFLFKLIWNNWPFFFLFVFQMISARGSDQKIRLSDSWPHLRSLMCNAWINIRKVCKKSAAFFFFRVCVSASRLQKFPPQLRESTILVWIPRRNFLFEVWNFVENSEKIQPSTNYRGGMGRKKIQISRITDERNRQVNCIPSLITLSTLMRPLFLCQ